MADTTIIGLCSGVGMLEEGVAAGLRYLGRKPRVLCHVERDAYAASVLLARMEVKAMEPSPVWVGNLEDVRWDQFAGAVDIVCAGFPCQPHSMAGSRKGTDDDRWIWPAIADCIRRVGPSIVLLENVPGLRSSGGFAPVLTDLAALGFRIEWDSVRASDVGASHQRERVFVLAYRDNIRNERNGRSRNGGERFTNNGCELAYRQSRGFGELREPSGRDGLTYWGDEAMAVSANIGHERRADSGREAVIGIEYPRNCVGNAGLQHQHAQQRVDGTEHQGAGSEVANTCQPGLQRRELGTARNSNGGGQEAHGSTTELRSLFAPGPSDPRWSDIITRWPDLAPATAKPEFCGLADGLAGQSDEYRSDRLRCGGNGVVALQAGLAFVQLAWRAGIA